MPCPYAERAQRLRLFLRWGIIPPDMGKQQISVIISGFFLLSLSACNGAQVNPTPDHFPTIPASVDEAGITPTLIAIVESTATPAATSTTAAPTEIIPSPTQTLRPCDEDTGQVIDESMFSPEVGSDVRYSVYLPPCYAQSQQRYPVLYMLHGWHPNNPTVMDNNQWIRMGLTDAADLGFSSGALPRMIIVMPNGNDAGYDFDAGPFPEFLTNDLRTAIEADLCTWNEPAMRAIGGLSRGGFFAYWIAFRYPELFGRVGGHSPFFYDPRFPDEENPFNLVDTAAIEGLAMYMDHGGFNRELNEVQPGVLEMLSHLRARGIEPEYVANPIGDHEESYWSSHTADYLAFYAEAWPRDIQQFPSCTTPSP